MERMPDGYPMKSTIGTKEIFTFRFPKFNNSVFYDPVVAFKTSEESTTSPSAAEASTSMSSELSSSAASSGETTPTVSMAATSGTTTTTSTGQKTTSCISAWLAGIGICLSAVYAQF